MRMIISSVNSLTFRLSHVYALALVLEAVVVSSLRRLFASIKTRSDVAGTLK